MWFVTPTTLVSRAANDARYETQALLARPLKQQSYVILMPKSL